MVNDLLREEFENGLHALSIVVRLINYLIIYYIVPCKFLSDPVSNFSFLKFVLFNCPNFTERSIINQFCFSKM